MVHRLFRLSSILGLMCIFILTTSFLCADAELVHDYEQSKSFWSMGKLHLKGLLIGKDQYRHQYLLHYGDRFDANKHAHSISMIRKKFHEQGYLQARITEKLEHDETIKTIHVSLSIDRGKIFSIGDVTFTMQEKNNEGSHSQVQNALKECARRLKNAYYSKVLIDQEIAAFRSSMLEKGILISSIELSEKIQYSARKVDLNFSLQIKQKREFIFFGNTHLSDTQLLKKLLLFKESAWLLPCSMLAQELLKEYQSRGFLEVSIETQEESDGCLFLIKEGQRLVIQEIQLHDITAFDSQMLITDYFSSALKNRIFDMNKIKDALSELIAFYIAQGFWDFSFLNLEWQIIQGTSSCKLILNFTESQRMLLRSSHIEEPYADLMKHEAWRLISSPTTFSMNVISDQQKVIESLLNEQKISFKKIKPTIERDGHHVAIMWRIEPQEQYTFGKTTIAYASRLPEKYLLRELQYEQGQPFDKNLVTQSINRLKDLNIFETVQMMPVVDSSQKYTKDIIIKAVPDDPYELRLHSGLSLQQMNKDFSFYNVAFVGGGSFTIKNPFNHADLLSLEVDYTRGLRTITGTYIRPWLFNYPIKTLFQAYVTQYIQPSLINFNKNLYEFRQHGFLVGFNKKKNYINVDLNVGFEWMETTIATKDQQQFFVDEVARALNFEPLLLDKRVPFFMLEPSLVFDTTDNKLNPTSGSLCLTTLKGMWPLKYLNLNSYFTKIYLDHSWYVPIHETVLALRVRFGHIFHKHFKNIMPAERFYCGGANSIRAYETDLCPPLGIVLNKHGKEILMPQGAQSMLTMNAEFRFPIYSVLSGAVFQDLGALSNTFFTDIKAKNLLAGTGFGIRLNTPIGPLRLDIAFKWHKPHALSSRCVWWLTFGNAF